MAIDRQHAGRAIAVCRLHGADRPRRKATKKRPAVPADDEGMDWSRFDAITDEEIAAAAARDPDCPAPKTPDELARMRRISDAKFIRRKLGMTRQQFADAYGIPLDVLVGWERREVEPSRAELAYLRAIEREPERIRKAAAS